MFRAPEVCLRIEQQQQPAARKKGDSRNVVLMLTEGVLRLYAVYRQPVPEPRPQLLQHEGPQLIYKVSLGAPQHQGPS